MGADHGRQRGDDHRVAGRDRPRNQHDTARDPGRRTWRRLGSRQARDGAVRACLSQPQVPVDVHRQQRKRAIVLRADAPHGRCSAADADASRRRAMECARVAMHDRAQHGHPSRNRTTAVVRRGRRRGGEAAGSRAADAQAEERVEAGRQVVAEGRRCVEGRWLRCLRHRLAGPEHAGRRSPPVANDRRHLDERRRSRAEGTTWRTRGRAPRRRYRSGRGHVPECPARSARRPAGVRRGTERRAE